VRVYVCAALCAADVQSDIIASTAENAVFLILNICWSPCDKSAENPGQHR